MMNRLNENNSNNIKVIKIINYITTNVYIYMYKLLTVM